MTCGELKGPPICLEVEEKEKVTFIYTHLEVQKRSKVFAIREDEPQRSFDEQEVKVGRMCGFKVEAQQLARGWPPLPLPCWWSVN